MNHLGQQGFPRGIPSKEVVQWVRNRPQKLFLMLHPDNTHIGFFNKMQIYDLGPMDFNVPPKVVTSIFTAYENPLPQPRIQPMSLGKEA